VSPAEAGHYVLQAYETAVAGGSLEKIDVRLSEQPCLRNLELLEQLERDLPTVLGRFPVAQDNLQFHEGTEVLNLIEATRVRPTRKTSRRFRTVPRTGRTAPSVSERIRAFRQGNRVYTDSLGPG
jgi:hypothetical protein